MLELELSNDTMEKITISLVREFLVRRGLFLTLKVLNQETSHLRSTLESYRSRRALAKDLQIVKWMRINKQTPKPLKSMLEVLIKTFLQEVSMNNLAVSPPKPILKKQTQLETGTRKDNRPTTSETELEVIHGIPIKHSSNNPVLMPLDVNPIQLFCQKIKETRNPCITHSRPSEDVEDVQYDSHNGCISNQASSASPAIVIESQIRPLPPFTQRALFARANRTSVSLSTDSGDSTTSNLTLGQNMLESKQNLLAKVNLSPEDDEIRQQAEMEGLNSIHDQLAPGSSTQLKKPSRSLSMTNATTDSQMRLRDVDAESGISTSVSAQGFDTERDSVSSWSSQSNQSVIRSEISQEAAGSLFFQKKAGRNMQSRVKTLDMATWRELKALILGPRGIMHEGWYGQGFSFSHKIPFGLVQKKGGPCGILSVVQALVLRNLFFGSEYCESGLTVPGSTESILTMSNASTTNHVTLKRSLALAGALTEIIWRCGGHDSASSLPLSVNSSPSKGNGDPAETGSGSTSKPTLCFNGAGSLALGPGSELRVFYDLDELKTVVKMNLHRFDCIGIVYSAVLSRGIHRIQEDMDFGNSPLLGQHGYCTQELLNLFTIGRAISNAFDHEYVLGDKVLKGLSAQADIGLLSLFEHYDSCRVGSFLKNPRFPLWIVCSESHFSLLFSNDLSLSRYPDASPDAFDLYYYDGLARQDKIIRLTIESSPTEDLSKKPPLRQVLGTLNGSNSLSAKSGADEDLIPPLEKCIRTKWNGVRVDWNDTEPIL